MKSNHQSKQERKSYLPPNWQLVTIRDVAVINELSIKSDYDFETIEYIDIASVNNGLIGETQELALSEAPSRAKRIIRENDILISCVRPNLRHYAFIKRAMPNSVASTGFAVITPKEVEARYLYYCLITNEYTEYLTRIAESHTSAYPAFNPDIIGNSKIPLPPVKEQQAIAHILGTLDDKIELNRRMNETLEGIARAIFKSWFIVFDPVRAKAEGRDPGLPKPIADLFPSRFIDTKLGRIPEGWRLSKMGDEFKIVMGQSPPGYTYNEEGKGSPFYQGRVDFGVRFPSRRVYCTMPTRFAEAGDTLVTVRAPVGDTNIAIERCCIGRGLAAVRHITGSSSYTYYFVKSLETIFKLFEAEGTVFGAVNKEGLNSIACVSPPNRVIELFDNLCEPLDMKIKQNELESRILSSLRDALLPKLISGQIRISEPGRIIRGKKYVNAFAD
ncbi:MAG: DNA polymerase beta domain-containing protein region [Firmicutes bacterium]|nr:DNA polymerase beta domain-containing protein region [Bacillota bacterium]